jgi:hypothetical protein
MDGYGCAVCSVLELLPDLHADQIGPLCLLLLLLILLCCFALMQTSCTAYGKLKEHYEARHPKDTLPPPEQFA